MATVSGLFTSPGRKTGVSTGHGRLQAVAGHGFEGCAHANPPKVAVGDELSLL